MTNTALLLQECGHVDGVRAAAVVGETWRQVAILPRKDRAPRRFGTQCPLGPTTAVAAASFNSVGSACSSICVNGTGSR